LIDLFICGISTNAVSSCHYTLSKCMTFNNKFEMLWTEAVTT